MLCKLLMSDFTVVYCKWKSYLGYASYLLLSSVKGQIFKKLTLCLIVDIHMFVYQFKSLFPVVHYITIYTQDTLGITC